MKEKENIYGDREDCLASDSNRVPSLDEKKQNEKKKKEIIADWLITCAKSSLHRHIRTYVHVYTRVHIEAYTYVQL